MTNTLLLTILPNHTDWADKLLDFLWSKVVEGLGDAASGIVRKISADGVYEVLDYESTLEIHDSRGTRATFSKTKKVRYLQNNVIAFQDYAWGDGNILLNYHTSRGKPVDLYRSGFKTYILKTLKVSSANLNLVWQSGHANQHVHHPRKPLGSMACLDGLWVQVPALRADGR